MPDSLTHGTSLDSPRFAAQRLAVAAIGPLDFELAPGDCLGLSGPSGAGKTRLLRAMADLDAHEGSVYLDGRAAADFDAPAWRRRVMLLAAEPAWWADTAGDHIDHGAGELQAMLVALDLDTGLLGRALGRLSSGQRQRLALLRMLALRPRVLLLDEPTANLDADNVARVERVIGEYCRNHGACGVWVGHDHAQLARIAGRRLSLDRHGQVVECT